MDLPGVQGTIPSWRGRERKLGRSGAVPSSDIINVPPSPNASSNSSWCLNEVATISQSLVRFGHRVLPVFYKVDPSNVAEDSGSYAATIELKHGTRNIPEDRKRWMDALKAVANCAGHTSQAIKIESELVKAIVKDALKILVDMSPRVKSDTLIGIDAGVTEVEKLLAMDVNDFRIIGLWGMGGVGKTTLAKACYQRFISSTKGTKHHFVKNIHQTCYKQRGIEGVVQDLYSALLSEDNLSYEDLDISYRRDRLSRLRVFLVFDDVETCSQLEHLLLGDFFNTLNLFALGSRIVVTTRNRRVLEYSGANIYHVRGLQFLKSLQLFGIHAFRKDTPPDDWMRLSAEAVSYCKGSPLAIKVLGGALFCRDKRYWQSFLLDLEKIPKPEIYDVLRRSYDALGSLEKRFFLDMACSSQSMQKSTLIKCMSTSHYPADHVVEDLIDKSLCICIPHESGEKIEVHDLLKKMAWDIVNEDSKLEDRSRLKNQDDIQKLLTMSKAKSRRAIECLILDLSHANEMYLEPNAFEGMSSLRLIQFMYSTKEVGTSKVHLPYGGLDILPDSLRWFWWDRFPSKSLPSRFSPENLVVLIMHGSLVMERCWEVQQMLMNLVALDLCHCINLVAIPDLSWSSNLEYLILEGCKSLIEVSFHVQDLDKLISLNLKDCTNLQTLPAKLNSKFLKYVRLSKCPKVIHCPEINSRELEIMDLEGTPVLALPSAIYNIKQAGELRLCGKHITSFPMISASLKLLRLCHTTIREMDCCDDHDQQGTLPRFGRLELVGNPQLKSLSRNIWEMVSQTLIIQDCPSIETLPEISQPVTGLTQVSITGCRDLKRFPPGINNLESLWGLCFTDTDIKSLPLCILELHQLSHLILSSNRSLEFIPSNICKLVKLYYLSLSDCSKIQRLPELPPNLLTLDVSGCELLQALPSNLGRLRWKSLYFEDCPHLDTNLPKEMVHNFPNHAVLNLHPQVVLQYSGEEIPGWFAYKSVDFENDSRLVVQLPPSNGTRVPKGIAFGVVCSSDIGLVEISITCDGNIGTIATASWSSPFFGLGPNQTSSAYMWYDKNLLGGIKKGIHEVAKPWYERFAGLIVSFRFSLQPYKGEDPDKLRSIRIKRIGISLLY
ncbi:unnamed protein product [Linum tenue]|uniref:Uncharacterized protein n=1 Tax=Linum tenue TaxID=586396 RepID=A0AAV0L448_9ROSI|nr:unnamed protein product [Linum tenue]